jgi:hypothetical protein
MPSALTTGDSSRGQDAAVAVRTVASSMKTIVARVTGCLVRPICHPIHSQAQTTTLIESLVTQPWAWSSTAIDLPAVASNTAGSVKGRRQHAVQATAAKAVTVATPATLSAVLFDDLPSWSAAQPQAYDVSDGSVQDGSITFM